VDITFDPAKNSANIKLRGLSFDRVHDFEFVTAITWVDRRKDYGEVRYRALGFIKDRIHALVYLETEKGIRVISLRKANERERRIYEQAQTRS
jgi:uncharacterized protein